jgi:hypothetical protein
MKRESGRVGEWERIVRTLVRMRMEEKDCANIPQHWGETSAAQVW